MRLDDNAALAAAAESGAPVIPIYINEPQDVGTGPLGSAQRWWLHHSLTALGRRFEAMGSRLILRSGDAATVLASLIAGTGAQTLYWNRRYDPKGIAIDTPLKQQMLERGIDVKSFAGQLLHEPARLLTGAGTPYRVYTPFWRALATAGDPPPPIEPPVRLAAPAQWPPGEELDTWSLPPKTPDWAATFREIFTPGEEEAQRRLDVFLQNSLAQYDQGRDFPARQATSLLSPHLAMGEISPARIWHSTIGLGDEIGTDNLIRFRKELAWRDFSYHLLFHFPDLATRNWNDRFDTFSWENDEARLGLWTRGQTGYPVVDAGMRELWRHGTMHNRVRMIAASFLIKDLLIDWRRGEQWFRDTLLDADPASNPASWQWVAGSGADASPWFRIFNPVTQGEKFDPKGAYVRRFVPEIAALGDKYIHRPFEAPAAELASAGITLGLTYPHPLVDHATARRRALDAYRLTGEEIHEAE